MADSGYPNYLTVGPDGKVNADFTGYIRARGVDLKGGIGNVYSATTEQEVFWRRQSDGSLLSEISGGYQEPNGPSWINNLAISPANSYTAMIAPQAHDSDNTQTWVEATVAGSQGGKTARVIDAAGKSSFVRAGAVDMVAPLNCTAANGSGVATGTLTVPRTSRVVMQFTATGYTAAPVQAYADCLINGVYQGSCALFFNTAGQHLTLAPFVYGGTLSAGTYTITVQAGGNLIRNTGDFATCLAFITPDPSAAQF